MSCRSRNSSVVTGAQRIRRFWTSSPQLFPHWIEEGLPVFQAHSERPFRRPPYPPFWTLFLGHLIAAAEPTTARVHPDRACGNSVHPRTRPVGFQDQIPSPSDLSKNTSTSVTWKISRPHRDTVSP